MTLLYVLLSGLLLVAALFVLLTTQVFYAALGFLCVLLGMAALYFLQGASFVAVACVIVYGGGSLVLVLFSTFLLPLGTKPTPTQRTKWMAVGSVLGLWGGGLWPLAHFAIYTLQQQEPVMPLQANAITGLGLQLLGPYVLAFEWVGVSLLIALVGVAGVMGHQSSSRHVS